MARLPMRAITQVNKPPMDPCALPPSSWKLGSSPDTDAPLERYHTAPGIDSRPPGATVYALMSDGRSLDDWPNGAADRAERKGDWPRRKRDIVGRQPKGRQPVGHAAGRRPWR